MDDSTGEVRQRYIGLPVAQGATREATGIKQISTTRITTPRLRYPLCYIAFQTPYFAGPGPNIASALSYHSSSACLVRPLQQIWLASVERDFFFIRPLRDSKLYRYRALCIAFDAVLMRVRLSFYARRLDLMKSLRCQAHTAPCTTLWRLHYSNTYSLMFL